MAAVAGDGGGGVRGPRQSRPRAVSAPDRKQVANAKPVKVVSKRIAPKPTGKALARLNEAMANAKMERAMRRNKANPSGEFRIMRRGVSPKAARGPSKVANSRAVDNRSPSKVRNSRGAGKAFPRPPARGGVDIGKFVGEVGRNIGGALDQALPFSSRTSGTPGRALRDAPRAREGLRRALGK